MSFFKKTFQRSSKRDQNRQHPPTTAPNPPPPLLPPPPPQWPNPQPPAPGPAPGWAPPAPGPVPPSYYVYRPPAGPDGVRAPPFPEPRPPPLPRPTVVAPKPQQLPLPIPHPDHPPARPKSTPAPAAIVYAPPPGPPPSHLQLAAPPPGPGPSVPRDRSSRLQRVTSNYRQVTETSFNNRAPGPTSEQPPAAERPPEPVPAQQSTSNRVPPSQRQFSIPGPDDLPPPVYEGPGTEEELTPEQVNLLLDGIESQVGQKNRGSVQVTSISFGNLIAYLPVVVGQPRDAEPMDRVKPAHASFSRMHVDKIDGLSGLDKLDIELQPSYEGKLPGTVSTDGLALEYRSYMNIRNPRANTVIVSSSRLPPVTLTQVLNRMTRLRIGFIFSTPVREAINLLDFIPSNILFADLTDPGGWKSQVTDLLMQLNRRDVFEDFSASSSMASLALSRPPGGMGLSNFYYQILLGYELLLRLKETKELSFSGITAQVNANLIISHRWFKNVTTTLVGADAQLRSNCHESQIEGLIRFAEIINWPWLSEMRDFAENVYSGLVSGGAAIGLSCWDWLFGTYLPGKYASYKIMAALVYCTPSLRDLGSALSYDSGLVLENRSYWRARTVLGRVLGGLRSANGVHGWVGPCPGVLVEGEPPSFKGYVRLHARRVEFVNTADRRRDDDEEDERGRGRSLKRRPGESTRSFLSDLGDMSKWTAPLAPGTSMVNISFEKVRLKKMPLESGQREIQREFQASLQFKVNGVMTTFTCYTLPTFVTAHPCIGEHVAHDREMGLYTGSVVELNQLKSLGSLTKGLTIINATARDGEVVARAWCSERGKHAIVRRSSGTCFACTCQLANRLNIEVLIWS